METSVKGWLLVDVEFLLIIVFLYFCPKPYAISVDESKCNYHEVIIRCQSSKDWYRRTVIRISVLNQAHSSLLFRVEWMYKLSCFQTPKKQLPRYRIRKLQSEGAETQRGEGLISPINSYAAVYLKHCNRIFKILESIVKKCT